MISELIAFIIMVIVTTLVWIGLLHNDIYSKQKDKRLHLLISAFISMIIGSITFITNNPMWYFIGMGFSLLIGLAKEFIWDLSFGKGKFELGDILADIVGACVLAPFTLFTIAIFIGLLS